MTTHNCPGLTHCDEHPRWMVIRAFYVDAPPQFSAHPWWVYRPGDDPVDARFATQPEAAAYATAQAHADQLAAIQGATPMTTHLARVAIPALLLLGAADGVLEMFGAHNSKEETTGEP